MEVMRKELIFLFNHEAKWNLTFATLDRNGRKCI